MLLANRSSSGVSIVLFRLGPDDAVDESYDFILSADVRFVRHVFSYDLIHLGVFCAIIPSVPLV